MKIEMKWRFNGIFLFSQKREVEMQQQLELQEESTLEIRETLTSVQQEVDVKTRKLKKCYTKYMVSGS